MKNIFTAQAARNGKQRRKMKQMYTIKKVFIALMIIISPVHKSSAGLMSFCKSVFSGKSHFNYVYIKNPLSHVLVSIHLQAQNAKWFADKKQIKMSDQGLKEMIEFLEHSPEPPPARLTVPLADLIQKSSEVITAVRQMPSEEARLFRQTALGVLSLFNKHLPILLKEDPGGMDWSRIHLITKQIAEFDPQSPRFSLYKIKRAIEGRYSLKEFILCRA